MKLSNSRVLVLGGAGFIGNHVVRELLKTDVGEVIIFDNLSRGSLANLNDVLQDKRCSIFQDGGDIREIDILNRAMTDVDGVFHLAAMWLLHCKDYPRTAFDVNVNGTFNILEAAEKNKIKKIIYSSSASVYGDAVEIPMTENHPFNNRNFYGATKIASEAMYRAFYDRYSLKYVGLRYMKVYGIGQDEKAAYSGVIPIMLRKIREGLTPIINGDGSQAYDFINVRDVARANVLAMESDVEDVNLNIGTGVQTSIHHLCKKILELTGSELDVEYLPYSDEDSRRMVKNRISSTEMAKSLINFQYLISLENGLKEIIKSFEINDQK